MTSVEQLQPVADTSLDHRVGALFPTSTLAVRVALIHSMDGGDMNQDTPTKISLRHINQW